MSTPDVVARPLRSDAPVKIATPATKISCRPNRSAAHAPRGVRGRGEHPLQRLDEPRIGRLQDLDRPILHAAERIHGRGHERLPLNVALPQRERIGDWGSGQPNGLLLHVQEGVHVGGPGFGVEEVVEAGRELVQAADKAMYLVKELTNASLPEIGRAFGGKHHTTVMHSIKRIEQQRQTDPDLNRLLHNLIDSLQ